MTEAIQEADLRTIERNLSVLANNIGNVDANVQDVDNKVASVQSEILTLRRQFNNYVEQQMLSNNLSVSETRVVKIRQEIEKNYGHYDEIRRTTVGILQADDLEIVRKEVITSASEKMMISAPGYWLAPCLVALSAWINDDHELADKALNEALKRDKQKTALLFALICRRANRKNASLKWTSYYLRSQDETQLDRNSIIIIDAFANGLLGVDAEGTVSNTLERWLTNLENRPNFTQQQEKQWGEALALYKPDKLNNPYPMLQQYSSNWVDLEDTLKGAYLHRNILDYFKEIFSKVDSTENTKKQLDEILMSLVTGFDSEELKYKREERLNELIIKYSGNKVRANQDMKVEDKSYVERKDFSQLLTDAALMNGGSGGSSSTQKFAIALSKDWIKDAYGDLILKNRNRVPEKVKYTVNGFSGVTENGENEIDSINNYQTDVEAKKQVELNKNKISKTRFYIGGVLGAIGIILALSGHTIIGVVLALFGGYWAIHSKRKIDIIEKRKQEIIQQFEDQKKDGANIIRQIMAETVDIRDEFAVADAEYNKVIEFLDQLTPQQYVRNLKTSTRHINVKSEA
ncbi:hypothetical protein [Companilactobacillus baiquanensis]|uniref:Uncharacterized protein n=1 Tax=Companilactobacillus baiquanensis TaxID=2486005 RepID=A0ABW1URB9_9LACO|nr:hypothetical protein [Companilactobacillus baiquanensis]